MLYEIHIKLVDGTTAKEAFTAVNDTKGIQRIESTLVRQARPGTGASYKHRRCQRT
jgi:hypothetical protein